MKNSCYNSFISLSEKTSVIFNALSDAFLFVYAIDKSIWNDPVKMGIEHPALFKKLCEHGFYVEDDVDEFQILQRLNRTIVENKKDYFIIINPTLACNYKCWYCYENHIPHSKMSAETLERVFKHMTHVVETQSQLQSFPIAFLGGEPLLYFKDIVLPIIRFHDGLCKQYNIPYKSIGFTSNGGLLKPEMIETLAQYKNMEFQITLDGGKELHNKTRYSFKGQDTYTLILHNISSLLRNGINVRLRINYTAEGLDSLTEIADDLSSLSEEERKYLTVDFHQVWQERKTEKDLEGIRAVIDYFTFKRFTVIFNDVNMVRNPCYGDRRNTAVINYNGDIYKCTAKDFNEANREGYLDKDGNIVWLKSQDYRANIRFKDGFCNTCRIAPLCGGGCSRYMLEQDQNANKSCLYKSEERIDELILDRLDMFIRNRQLYG